MGPARACVDMLRWFASTQIRNVACLAGKPFFIIAAAADRNFAGIAVCVVGASYAAILCVVVVYALLAVRPQPRPCRYDGRLRCCYP